MKLLFYFGLFVAAGFVVGIVLGNIHATGGLPEEEGPVPTETIWPAKEWRY